ncbi:MAG TPA: lytic transglycosylase domain-containing protein, partial [Candidatus Deferrimicrobium sp.]|nr:lytic transglycosylase domain-containing protein [Candidatus Deferrimicrobium sp.]
STKNAQETFSQPDLLKINDPFIADVIKLKIAETLVKEKKYPQAETLIMSLDNSHGYLAKRITGLYLEILYFQQKYAHFIQRYEAAPVTDNLPNLHTQILYLNSLMKSGAKEKTEKAVGIFKKLFLHNQLKPFKELMSPADLSYCLQKMSSDEWFQKLTYLAEKNFFTEFLKEKAYLNSGQLVNLFYAEFYYKKKQYKKVEQSLCTVDNPKLRPYKQKLLIKIQLRRNHYEGILVDIEKLKNNEVLYAETLLDAAGILLIQHEDTLSLSLFEKYIAFMKEKAAEKYPGKVITDPDYWRAKWTAAWLHHRANHTEKALPYFEKGLQASAISYKIANTYWYHRFKNADTLYSASSMEDYPFTYYYTKIHNQPYGTPLNGNDNGLKRFTALIDGKQGPMFLTLLAQLKSLLENGLIDESFDFVQWAKTGHGLTDSEKNTFKIIESILYLKKKDFYHTFIAFRDNFDNYPALRLPRFLRSIYCPIRFENLVTTYSNQYNLDRYMVFALIREESFFNPTIVSPARANGLMQLLFGTAKTAARKQGIRINKFDLFNPRINIRLGIDYLKDLLDKYDNKTHLALAAYNAGYSRVDEWLEQFGNVPEDEFIEMIPFTETRNYVKNILRNYYYYK